MTRKLKFLLIIAFYSLNFINLLYAQSFPTNDPVNDPEGDEFLNGKTKLEGIVENRRMIETLQKKITQLEKKHAQLEQELSAQKQLIKQMGSQKEKK